MGDKNQGRKGGLRKWFGLKDNPQIVDSVSNNAGFTDQSDFNLNEKFLSDVEIKFYKVLKNMASGRLEIFPKVSLTDVFSNPRIVNSEHRQQVYQSYIDFLLCDSETFKPVLAVELIDSSLSPDGSVEKYDGLSSVFAGSDLPFVQLQSQESYQISELARTFREAIENAFNTIEEEVGNQGSG
jgi:hypothetical protein